MSQVQLRVSRCATKLTSGVCGAFCSQRPLHVGQGRETITKLFQIGVPTWKPHTICPFRCVAWVSSRRQSEPKCTTASQPQSLAIFEAQTKSQGISAARSKFGHFSSQNHFNASQPQPYRYRREITSDFPERIAAYSLTA